VSVAAAWQGQKQTERFLKVNRENAKRDSLTISLKEDIVFQYFDSFLVLFYSLIVESALFPFMIPIEFYESNPYVSNQI
jgi:hypothetical protein